MRTLQNLLLAATLLAFSAALPVTAAETTPGLLEVAEVSSLALSLPASAGGTASLRRCDRCALVTVRATTATSYFVDGQRVSLAELRTAIAGRGVYVEVSYLVPANTLVRVAAQTQVPFN